MASNRSQAPEVSQPSLKLLVRPPFQLRSLPIRYRWEATRRHPYYQMWWKEAAAFYRQEAYENVGELLMRQMAMAILAHIGVTSEPPDPATAFDELDDDQPNVAWLSGAVLNAYQRVPGRQG